MPDEAPEHQDTPTDEQPAAPLDGTPAPESDDSNAPNWDVDDNPYKGRYDDLRKDYTQKSQSLSQYEQFIESLQNEDTQAQALQALGLALDAEDNDDEYADPEDVIGKRLDGIESFLNEQREAAAQAEVENLTNAYLNQELDKIDPDGEFSDEYVELVVALADDFEDDEGLPDVEAAHKALQKQFESERKNYVKSKRTAQAPSGASPSHQPDMDDDEQRRDWIARQLLDNEAAA